MDFDLTKIKDLDYILKNFSKYMQECLYSKSGFYQKNNGKSAVKHFVTAATTSMAFRKAIFNRLKKFIDKYGQNINVVDYGAGNADLLFSLKKLCEKDKSIDIENIVFTAIEISKSALITIEVLHPWMRVSDQYDVDTSLPTFIIANELFDNLCVDLEEVEGIYYPRLIQAKDIIKDISGDKIELILADYFIDNNGIKELGTSKPPKYIRGYRDQQLVPHWHLYPYLCDVTVDLHKEQVIELFEQNDFVLEEEIPQREFVKKNIGDEEFFDHTKFDVLIFRK